LQRAVSVFVLLANSSVSCGSGARISGFSGWSKYTVVLFAFVLTTALVGTGPLGCDNALKKLGGRIAAVPLLHRYAGE